MRSRSLLLMLTLLAAPALAEETYFTLGMARGTFEPTAPAGCTLDASSASDVGANLGVGFRFDGPFAVEFGYQTLGSLDLTGVCGIAADPLELPAPDSGLSVSGLGRLGLGQRWALFGRVGAYSWSSAGDGATELQLGVGAEYEWRKGMAVRLEYSAFGDEVDAIGLSFRFGF